MRHARAPKGVFGELSGRGLTYRNDRPQRLTDRREQPAAKSPAAQFRPSALPSSLFRWLRR
jgi:hypothetical protein